LALFGSESIHWKLATEKLTRAYFLTAQRTSYAINVALGATLSVKNSCFVDNDFVGEGAVIVQQEEDILESSGNYGTFDDDLKCQFISIIGTNCRDYDSDVCVTGYPTSTAEPTQYPTSSRQPTTMALSSPPTQQPIPMPIVKPSRAPTGTPSLNPSGSPSLNPTGAPTTSQPTPGPSPSPTLKPSPGPSLNPTVASSSSSSGPVCHAILAFLLPAFYLMRMIRDH